MGREGLELFILGNTTQHCTRSAVAHTSLNSRSQCLGVEGKPNRWKGDQFPVALAAAATERRIVSMSAAVAMLEPAISARRPGWGSR